MSEKVPGKDNKPGMYDSYSKSLARILGMALASGIVILILMVIIWALVQIGEDIRASL